MTRDEFIRKAMLVHAGEGIDYSKVEYVNNRTKVLLIDPVYGEFWQTPGNHLTGHSHPSRRRLKISGSKRLSQEEVIDRFMKVHAGESLDYSKVRYVNMHEKVCIIDPEYGEFWQEPAVHLKGCVHPMRALRRNASNSMYTTEKFKELAFKVYGTRFDLSKVEYAGSKTKVCIICPEHGEFMQYPDAFLQGKSCPKCGNHLSHGEDWLYEMLCERLGKNEVVRNDRTVLGDLELDIYVPSRKVAIEFDGLRWHSEEFGKDRHYHINKTERCNAVGIGLIHIFEDEWLKAREIVSEKVLRLLRISCPSKVFDARRTSVNAISRDVSREFLEKNHIQGYVASSLHLGCFSDGMLIGVMSFKDYGSGNSELTRFATLYDSLCRGVGGKLFSYFVNNYSPLYVKSFADRRWTLDSDDNLYVRLGFKLDSILPPDYRYTNGHGIRFHKFGFRKDILSKKYGFPIEMTEHEMAVKAGFYRIWNCGLFKYVWLREG